MRRTGFVTAVAGFAVAGLALSGLSGAAAGEARFDDFRYEGRSQESAIPGPGEFRNPVVSGYAPDPAVTRVGKYFYLVTSSFSHFPGLPVYRSTDLANWTQIANAIDRPSQLDFKGRAVSDSVFAPDISYAHGLYWIANTCVRCGGNFVITAKNPAGPWSDPFWLPFEGIDPSIFWDGDKAWIINNDAPNEPPRYDGHRALWVQQFDWKTKKMFGPRTQVVNGGVDLSKKPIWIEGPHLYRKDGWIYLTAAEGGTAVGHSQVVLRSKEVTGPFVPYEGNPILTQRDLDPARPNPITSAGHAKLVQTPKGDWWATFLAVRPWKDDYYNIGRETFLLPVEWKNGWPHILEPGKAIPYVAKRPNLPAGPKPKRPLSGDFGWTETFDSRKLDLGWMGVRIPATPFHRVERGSLVLTGAAPLGDINGTPAFLGTRQRHHVATVSTTMRYAPDREGDRAGLVAMQSDENFLFFGVAMTGGKPTVTITMRDRASTDTVVASAPLTATGPITFTIRADGGTMALDYTVGGKTETPKSGLDATFLSTRRAGGFVGTLFGPYAYKAGA